MITCADGMYTLDRLQFHNEAAFDEQIQFQIGSNALAPVLEADAPIALNQKVSASEYTCRHG